MFARDLLWKFLCVISVVLMVIAVIAWLFEGFRELRWQGPELTSSNPILLAVALKDLWTQYSGTLAWTAIGVLLGIAILWIVFEALFRGGRQFWLYAGSRVAGVVIMGAATVLLAALTAHEGIPAGIASAIVLLGLWWTVTLTETLLRRDAVQLLTTDLLVVLAAMAVFLGIHLCLTAAVLATGGLGTVLMFRASSPPQFFAAALLMFAVIFLWTIVHSYLIVVRYSTIDIMRGNVVDL